ncbi:MAG: very short patch repair endonuclease [Candidatus Omnitrophota bacterium]
MSIKRTKEQISYNMSRIKAKGTSIEKIIRRGLRKNKIKFRGNVKTVIGKPDFIVKDTKIAVFCDSVFWHGYRFGKTKTHYFKRNKKFWENKIKNNIIRDRWVNKELRRQGWIVIRFWDFQIKREPDKCVQIIKNSL